MSSIEAQGAFAAAQFGPILKEHLRASTIAIAFALTLSCVAATASAEQCDDKLQQDKSQQNSADEAQVRGDLKASSQCATPGDKQESAKKNEDRVAKLKSEGKVEDHTTTGQAPAKE